MSTPFFSIITPSWKQGPFLRRCIESVLSQNEPDFEHLIFDNNSRDESSCVAAEFSHVQFVSESDRGQSHAVNKGLAAAKGEIICWLNVDDEYMPETFSALREAFTDPAVDVVFGDVRQIEYVGHGEHIAQGKFDSRIDLIRWWSSQVKLHQPAVFFRRQVSEKIGHLSEDLHYAMDYEYWWRMSKEFAFHYIPKVFAIQHRQPDSKTIQAWHRVLHERERIFSQHYGMIDSGDRRTLLREKKHDLAQQFLLNAWASVVWDRRLAQEEFLRALRASPSEVFRLKNVGLVRRLLFP